LRARNLAARERSAYGTPEAAAAEDRLPPAGCDSHESGAPDGRW
jgi:hypothetical protein